ncbi:MAG: adenylate/guanylate cyclase domain-containing protein [Leptospira sp.]|nr:adenylate/guanylate cyclase domain-containing protein [Leptospira sp.]
MSRNVSAEMAGLLDGEILGAEVRRTSILSALFMLVGLAFNIAGFLTPDKMLSRLGQEFPLRELQIFWVVAIAYEFAAYSFFRFMKKNNLRLSHIFRYANAFVETSLPTIPILFISASIGSVPGLNSPALFAYPVFILLSILGIDWRVCVFTGCIAALEYFGVAAYYLRYLGRPEFPTFLEELGVYLIRSGFLSVMGLAAGFVAAQLRRRITATLESMQDAMLSMLERDQIIGVFGRHVSPEVANRLLRDSADSGEKRAVSVLFLDIRDFTRFSEKRTPEEVFQFLNRLFAVVIEIIHSNNGIINKFLGDGLMAVFGAPIDSDQHKLESVQTALTILSAIEDRIQSGELPPLKVGIGIHSGEAMTGNVGSETRMEYTIIGDVVNVASRLEKATKSVGTRLLVSSKVYEDLTEKVKQSLSHRGQLKVRGRDEALPVYGME